ncbi:hypothetical protein PPEP_a3745 [Pseudoalteromonas peptidolytica F12-50-A1]|uniref:Uncharacterized protein n=1 Tax=Pseudoalteromonas peptidolytica F12-50-A1 TaxID=1315280 RepID=A0A8I0MVA4_9GAMM|nr:hypothetical protein [Pseudoalteromonas peptidolytica F12-50-A1]
MPYVPFQLDYQLVIAKQNSLKHIKKTSRGHEIEKFFCLL